MARINIEEQFWTEITAVTRKLKGDEDKAVGQAIRLFRVAQQRAKNGQIVTDEDWQIHEFSDALIPVFAKKVEGGYVVQGTEKHFGWLKKRAESGRRGGEKSGESRRNEINNLSEAKPSKPKQVEPSPSPSCSTSTNVLENTNTSHCPDNEQPDLSPDLGDGLHWLAQVWNDFCGPHLKKVKTTTPNTDRMRKIQARIKKHPDRQQWALAIRNLAKSKFHTGQKGKPGEQAWKADFDWFLSKEANFTRGIEDTFAGSEQKHFTHERENEPTADEILADVYKQHGMEVHGGIKSR